MLLMSLESIQEKIQSQMSLLQKTLSITPPKIKEEVKLNQSKMERESEVPHGLRSSNYNNFFEKSLPK